MLLNEEIIRYIKPDYLNICKSRMGSAFYPYKAKTNVGFLVLGINPAGDEKDVINEQNRDFIHLKYVNGLKFNKKYIYTNYFKPIYDLANTIFKNDAKWDWCNLDENEIDSFLSNNSIIGQDKDAIKDFYFNHKKRNVTIYVGDLIYIHETSQNNLLKWIDFDHIFDYVQKSLDQHIEILKNVGIKNIYIYINNAKVSDLIIKAINGGKKELMIRYNGSKIFLGSMISGSRAMDVFSRKRLINEITKELTT